MLYLRSVLGVGLLLAGGVLPAAEPAADELPPEIREAQKLAAQIDRQIAARWTERGVKPAAATGDGEFLRRVHLDLTGRIPRPVDLLDFRDRYAAHAREQWINKELLESSEYSQHFAATWRPLIVPADNNQLLAMNGDPIGQWLRQKFKENAHYDQIARELLASPNDSRSVTNQFFQANQLKPANLAATTSRLFLGVKLECAQCHDHPFARWTRRQFWEYAAFFAGIQATGENVDRRQIEIAGTDRVVGARFLDGKQPAWQKEVTPRETLVEWMLRADNPFFARAAVNRFWAHFFGLGLVEPVDDLSDQNPASHPELLELLAREFAAHGYDVKYLIRAITFSNTYQLSSMSANPARPSEPRLFARMNLKGLTGEQLYDSLFIAMGKETAAPARRNGGIGVMNDARFDFITRFARQENRTEYHTSILQALTMMNGKLIDEATNPQTCPTLEKCFKPEFDPDQPLPTPWQIETIYMAVLTRKPRPYELKRCVAYVDSGGPKKDPKAALGDVFWALLNSGEFLLNH